MVARNIKTREGYEFWDKLCAIPKFGFLLSPSGDRVQKMAGIGNWIDRDEAMQCMSDAQDEINALRAENAELVAALEGAQRIINHQGWSANEQPAYDFIDAALAKHRGE